MNTRPIAILPAITKVFEFSILRNLERIFYEQSYISNNQREFTLRWVQLKTLMIYLIFEWKPKKEGKKTRSSSTLIFIDLKLHTTV